MESSKRRKVEDSANGDDIEVLDGFPASRLFSQVGSALLRKLCAEGEAL